MAQLAESRHNTNSYWKNANLRQAQYHTRSQSTPPHFMGIISALTHAGTGHASHESLVYLSSLYNSSNSPTAICSILKEAAYISKQLGARTNPPHTALPTHTDRHMSHIMSEYLTANHTADLWYSVAHSALYRCTMQMHNADARMHRPTKRAMA